ncbi:MAG TPA: hypothetical protein VF012_05610 [Nocardioidaceae bacterium]
MPDADHPRDLLGHGPDVVDRAWLWQELRTLPTSQRTGIVLRYYEDLSEAQSAEATAARSALPQLVDRAGTTEADGLVAPGTAVSGSTTVRPTFVDVAAGRIAYIDDDESSRLLVGEAIGEDAEQMPSGWNGVLSPDGRYIGVERLTR